MTFDVIIGRSKKDVEKLGKKGTVFIAKQFVKMGQTTSLSNPVYLDVSGAHVIFLCGKRGSGKSYTMGSIAEGLADLPKNIKQNLSIVLLDTMGIYWTMKYPNYQDAALLREWGFEPKPLDVKIYTPSGFYYKYKEEGIPTDFPFSITPTDVGPEDWLDTFKVPANSAEGVLLTKIVQTKNDAIKDIKDASVKIAIESTSKIIQTSIDKSKLDAFFKRNLEQIKNSLKKTTRA